MRSTAIKVEKVTPFAFEGNISIDNRALFQSVSRAMQGNILMALIELITNSNDSYNRLGQVKRKITINYGKKDKFKGVFSVHDEAEGLNIDDFEKKLTKYWQTSDLQEDNSQRGYFGKGAKDALGYMDDGQIVSFKDGRFIQCSIFFDEHKILKYKVMKSCRATPALRKKYKVKVNGTVASFIADPQKDKKIKVPQFNTLHDELSNHYLLRKILQDDNAIVVLVDNRGRKRDKRRMSYVNPKGTGIFDEKFKLEYEDYDTFEIDMSVLRSDSVLSQKEKGDTRTGGLLILDDKGVVLDISLFKYDYDPIASKLYGEVVVSGFRKLLKNRETVLSPERDGLIRTHPFVENLISEIQKRLDVLVQREKDNHQRFDVTKIDKGYQKRQKAFCRLLNEIADEVLGVQIEKTSKELAYPINGFHMTPTSLQVSADKHTVFSLRIDTKKVAPGTVVELESTNPLIKITNGKKIVVQRSVDKNNSIVTKHITVCGSKPNESGKIKAKAPDRTATGDVFILSPIDIGEYGIVFRYDNIQVQPNKTRKLLLLASTKKIKTADVIEIESDNEHIHTNIDKIVVNEADAVRGVLEYELEVWGDGEGQEGIITASCTTSGATAWECANMVGVEVRYHSKKPDKIKGETFTNYEFRSEPDPPQAASYSKEMEKVYIYSKFPTVQNYVGKHMEFMYSLPAQIFITNLVLERYFYQLAFKFIDNKGIIYSEKNKHDAIQREANELMGRFGKKITDVLVDQTLLRKVLKGQVK